MVAIIILIVVILLILMSCIVIVPQGEEYVVEMLGRYYATWSAGPHLKAPFVARVARKVNVKENLIDSAPIPVISKDNVTLSIDFVVYYKVFDAKLFTYGNSDSVHAMDMLAATTLRNIIGGMTLDESLTSRDQVNERMRTVLDDGTDSNGIKVTRVEIKSITPPASVKQAMERQVTAERNKRAEILEADGHKQSDILKAEGHKQALILDAEAEKQKKILDAEAEEQAMIDRAKGRAEAIRMVQQANADGIAVIKKAGPDEAVLKFKKIEAVKTLADGKATKIVVPSDLANFTSLGELLGESVKSGTAELPAESDDAEQPEIPFDPDAEPRYINNPVR